MSVSYPISLSYPTALLKKKNGSERIRIYYWLKDRGVRAIFDDTSKVIRFQNDRDRDWALRHPLLAPKRASTYESRQRFFTNARYTHLAALYLLNTSDNPVRIDGVTVTLNSQGLVDIALAIELYLKLMTFMRTGKWLVGHDLAELFRSQDRWTRKLVLWKFNKGPSGWTMIELWSKFREQDCTFAEWRYRHEHYELWASQGLLKKLAKSCYEAVIEIDASLPYLMPQDKLEPIDYSV